MSNFELALLFFLQIAVVLGACASVGALARWIGQPQVVGEMITGVLLGPSLFGLLVPHLQHALFPKPAMATLYAVSQVGLVLYMFVIGMEFESSHIKSRWRSALSVSVAGIAAPWLLGALIATVLVSAGMAMFAPTVSSWEAALFLGAAMSITAFPMLARIIHERGLANTPLGTLALAAGATDDALAWCMLAVVLASFSGNAMVAVSAVGGGIAYVVVVLGVVAPVLRWLDARARSAPARNMLGVGTLVAVMFGAWFTDWIGIYAVFGAFVMGMAVPRGLLADALRRMIEPLTVSLLLPLFFIYSGLNTQITLVATPALWVITGVVIAAATAGKGIACWAAARLTGESQHNALGIGVLMNARGLMELIILNIGLERGIISPTLFTIMVLMAIATTLMCSPLFAFVTRSRTKQAAPISAPATP